VNPLSFQPDRVEHDKISIEAYNSLMEELEAAKDELKRCRQKVAHLLKEKESSEK
jgi:hypothetical protein